MAITTNYRTRSDAVPLRSFKTKGRQSAIAGIGVYAPEKVLSNFDLEKMMDTSDKWITERTGIHRRHIDANAGDRRLPAFGLEGAERHRVRACAVAGGDRHRR